MQRIRIIGIVLAVLLTACEETTFQSSVPVYPVHVVIDTKTLFVDFTQENTNAYITVNQEGYKENDKYLAPLKVTDAYGYGGVVAYVSMNGYVAYDLACPYCAGRGTCQPCVMNGIYAECQHCGEKYELASGYALPQNGISREALRKLKLIHSDGKITISQ